METKEKETELVQLVRQLRDYVILDRKDYEKLVQNSSPEKFNESALEARDAQIKLLEQQLAHQEDWVNYWKNKYEQKSISRDGQKVIIDNSRGLRLGFFY